MRLTEILPRLALCAVILPACSTAQPVPGTWQGRARGSVGNQAFDVPVTVQLRPALPFEKNPFHLFVGTGSVKQVGDLGLVSALEVGTGGPTVVYEPGLYGVGIHRRTTGRQQGRGNVTLQFLSIRREGPRVVASLTNPHTDTATAANAFTGPNVSAREASELMRGVHEALGPTEMFVFLRGATLSLEFTPTAVQGSVSGAGRSVTNTSSDVPYHCTIEAKRTK